MKRYLNISEIASYTGFNEYDPISSFDRLWKRYDTKNYTNCLDKLKNKLEKTKTEEKTLTEKIDHVEKMGGNTEILKKQLIQTKEKQEEVKAQVVKDLKKSDKLVEYLGKEIIEKINNETEIENKKKVIEQTIEKSDLSKKEKQTLLKDGESFVNTDHGMKQEDSAIVMFETKYKVTLDTSQKYNCKEFKKNWFIGGKVDGLYISDNPDKSYVVEIKNRAKGFFNGLRNYEKVQVQLYMWMLDISCTKLAERYNSKLRITKIYRDDQFISNVLDKLTLFIDRFEEFLNTTLEDKYKYISFSDSSKLNYIYKLYLTDILKLDMSEDLESESEMCLLSSS